MKIVVIGVRGLPAVIGGIETHCEQLYPQMTDLRTDYRTTLLIRRGYTPERRFTYRDLEIQALWSPIFWGVDTLIHTFWALIYARARLSPDIVHIHGIGPGFFAPLARLLGFVTVVTHHAPDYSRPKWGRPGRIFLKIGERFSAAFADAVICVSESVRRDFLAGYPGAKDRTTVIRNAGGFQKIAEPRQTRVLEELDLAPAGYVLAVGRLEATKGFDTLIAAFKIARPPGMKLVIVGADAGNFDHADALRASADTDVVFAGFRTRADLLRLYGAAALFVHPSYMEGYGLVVAEALSVDVPVIVSDIPPHREFGLKERCYFPPGDVAALAAKLRSEDYAVFRDGAAGARQREDSWRRAALEHVALFDRLTARSDT